MVVVRHHPEFQRSQPFVRATTAPIRVVPALRIQSYIEGAVLHLVVSGELDMATDGALRDAIADATVRLVHLDLGGVSFMACSTLKLLLPSDGTRLLIRAASPFVRRLLGLAGLDDLQTVL